MRSVGDTAVKEDLSTRYQRQADNMDDLTYEKRQLYDIQGRLFEQDGSSP